MFRHLSLRLLFGLCALVLLPALPLPAFEAGGEEADEEFAPPPEGFEEHYYTISDLTDPPVEFAEKEHPAGLAVAERAANAPCLSAENVMELIRVCTAPESWRARGQARMTAVDGSLFIVQKKEVHEEIVKVLRWLREGVMAPFRATVVVAPLKPEAIARFAENPAPLTGAELLKALEAAVAPPQIIELRGIEAQRVTVSGTERVRYVRDVDVCGAVYDPVVDTVLTGLRVTAVGYRSPDCKQIHLELSAALDRDVTMESARISTTLVATGDVPPTPPEPEEGKEAPPAPPPAAVKRVAAVPAEQSKLSLPSTTTAALHAVAAVPQNRFVLAGTLDLTLANKDMAPERLALFVRATINGDGVPALAGVSGLKPGEVFRLYPTFALTRSVPENAGPDFSDTWTPAGAGGAANAFAQGPASAPTVNLRKAKGLFQEQVRKDKLVEPTGPVIFTRLTEPDHQKLTDALMSDLRRHFALVRMHALALSVPADAAQRFLLDDGKALDLNAIAALAKTNGAQVLMDEQLGLLARQRTFVMAGRKRSLVADYDISGDSYDPLILTLLERGFVLDVKPDPTADGKTFDLQLRFQAVPRQSAVSRTTMEGYSVNSGTSANLVLAVNADLDLPKFQTINIREHVSIPAGQYVLAGAAAAPLGDEPKPEPRQVLLFIRIDEQGK